MKAIFIFPSYNDPYLNRFLQPDTIIPSLYNPQSLNRYSFVGNNPINYSDPTGHWRTEDTGSRNGCYDPKYCNGGQPKSAEELKKMRGDATSFNWDNIVKDITPHGTKRSIVITAGWDTNLVANGKKVPTILYWGLSFVTDDDGYAQFFFETLDIKFDPTLELLFAEKNKPSMLDGLGLSATRGLIWGNKFTTNKYTGEAYSKGISGEVITIDYNVSVSDPNIKGVDVGVSFGSPSIWSIAVNGPRIPLGFIEPLFQSIP